MRTNGPVISDRDRIHLLRQHGGFALAYSATMQPGLKYFGDASGFIAYADIAGTAPVLAGPIAPQDVQFRAFSDHIDSFDRIFASAGKARSTPWSG